MTSSRQSSLSARPRSSSPENVDVPTSVRSLARFSFARMIHSRWQREPEAVSYSTRSVPLARVAGHESRSLYQSTSPMGRSQGSSRPKTVYVGGRAKTVYADQPASRTRYGMQPARPKAYPRATTYYEMPPPLQQPNRQPLATHYESPAALEADILRVPTPTTYGAPPVRASGTEEACGMYQPAKTIYGYPPGRASTPSSSHSSGKEMPEVDESRATTKPGRSSGEALVECQAVFVNKPVCWTFQLPSDTPVKQAVAKAEEEAVKRSGALFQDAGKCVTVLPSVSREAMVGEWSHQNMGQSPLVIFSGGEKESESQGGQQQVLEEQLEMMTVVQKRLNEQCAVIQNQESFIMELQSRSRQNWQQLEDALHAIESDVSDIKERIHVLQDVETPIGQSFSENKNGRRRRQK